MSDSIKQRMGGSHIGKMNDKELRKLLQAALTDLGVLRTAINTIAADNANVQVVTNNLVALSVALKAQMNNVVADTSNVQNVTNNLVTLSVALKTQFNVLVSDVNNINQATVINNQAINTTVTAAVVANNVTAVTLTATSPVTNNVSAVTLGQVANVAALTLVA